MATAKKTTTKATASRKKKTDSDSEEMDPSERIVLQSTYGGGETTSRYDGYTYFDPDEE